MNEMTRCHCEEVGGDLRWCSCQIAHMSRLYQHTYYLSPVLVGRNHLVGGDSSSGGTDDPKSMFGYTPGGCSRGCIENN
uniref:Putative ovule protein n=1 Tax=Solanum chacoense TaxID=4108 RepID=A0A0V0GSR1_SOLCH